MKAQVKRGLGIICMFVLLCMTAQSAIAQAAYEPFNYTAGTAPGSGGTGWSGAWIPCGSKVVAPGLTFTGLPTSGNALGKTSGAMCSRSLATPAVGTPGSSLVLSALMKSDANGTAATQATLGNSSGEMFIIGEMSGHWGLQNATDENLSPVPVVANQTVYLVAQIDFNAGSSNDRMRLWVQTTQPAVPYFTTKPSVDVTNANVSTFSGVTWQTQQNQVVDEIRVGTTQGSCVKPPNTTMVAWYPFDATGGTAVANIASGNTGTRFGAAPIAGIVARALHFNGSSNYVQAPSTILTNIGPAGLANICNGGYSTCRGDFSIDAWIRLHYPASPNVMTILDKRSGSSPSMLRGYHFYVTQQNVLGLQLADGIGGVFSDYFSAPILSPALDDGLWHHVAVTVDRRFNNSNTTGYIRWYHNGALISTSNPIDRLGSLVNNSPMRIGRRTVTFQPPAWFNGDIDELEMFNRVLSVIEVKSIFNAGPFGKCK